MQVTSMNKHNPSQLSTESKNQFPLSNSQIEQYKSTFETLSIQKKKNYLQAIQSQNHDLTHKIKELDKNINCQMESLSKKIVPNQKRKPGAQKLFQQAQTTELTQKFQQYEKLKKQLQLKKTGTDSLQFLLLVKQQQAGKIQMLDKKISQVKSEIASLQKIKTKFQFHQGTLKKELVRVGEFSMFTNQIQQLKLKVKEKSDQIKSKKQQFMSIYKKNRSNKSMIAQDVSKDSKVQQIDPQLQQLKRTYTLMGKKVQILKSRRQALKKQPKTQLSQLQSQLSKLKQKYESLCKLNK